jgi:hypothetical protein
VLLPVNAGIVAAPSWLMSDRRTTFSTVSRKIFASSHSAQFSIYHFSPSTDMTDTVKARLSLADLDHTSTCGTATGPSNPPPSRLSAHAIEICTILDRSARNP